MATHIITPGAWSIRQYQMQADYVHSPQSVLLQPVHIYTFCAENKPISLLKVCDVAV